MVVIAAIRVSREVLAVEKSKLETVEELVVIVATGVEIAVGIDTWVIWRIFLLPTQQYQNEELCSVG